MILLKYAGCVCAEFLCLRIVFQGFEAFVSGQDTWIRWHKPEAIFSVQVWERKLSENISSLVALTLSPLILFLLLCLPCFFPLTPRLKLASGNTQMMKGAGLFSPSPSTHSSSGCSRFLFTWPGALTSQRKRQVLWWCNPSPFSNNPSTPPHPTIPKLLWTQKKPHYILSLQFAIRPLLSDLSVLSTQSSHPCQGQLKHLAPISPHYYWQPLIWHRCEFCYLCSDKEEKEVEGTVTRGSCRPCCFFNTISPGAQPRSWASSNTMWVWAECWCNSFGAGAMGNYSGKIFNGENNTEFGAKQVVQLVRHYLVYSFWNCFSRDPNALKLIHCILVLSHPCAGSHSELYPHTSYCANNNKPTLEKEQPFLWRGWACQCVRLRVCIYSPAASFNNPGFVCLFSSTWECDERRRLQLS